MKRINKILLINLILLLPSFVMQSMEIEKPSQRWQGNYYAQHSEPQRQFALKLLEPVKLPRYKRILDIGCGSGEITAEIAKRAPDSEVVGLDAASDMIETAKQHYSPVKNLSFEQCDVAKLNLPNKFDFATSFACFHWVKDQQEALKKIYGHLNNQGKVLICMSGRKNDHPLRKAFIKILKNPEWGQFISRETLQSECTPQDTETFAKLLYNAQFKNIYVEQENIKRVFPNEEEFKHWLKAWIVGFPSVAALLEKKPEFFDALVDQYKKNVQTNSDGSIEYIISYLVACAEK